MRALNRLKIFAVLGAWWPIFAFAEGGLGPNPREGQNEPVRLSEGETAPFPGMLVPIDIAASITARAEGCDLRIDTARKQERELADLDLELEEELRAGDAEVCTAQIDLLEHHLREVQPAWWEHPAIWFGVGMVATIAVVVGSVSILDATRPIVVDRHFSTY